MESNQLNPATGQTRRSQSSGRPAAVGRRRFLVWLARGSLGATIALVIDQIFRFLSYQPPGATSPLVPLGLPGDYPFGTTAYNTEARVYVGHDAEGLYALDAVCPHLGCLVEREDKTKYICPCHGSYFDASGQVKTGPATESLRHLILWLGEDGQLIVDRDQPVEPAVRLVI